jgi:hypothetical protein
VNITIGRRGRYEGDVKSLTMVVDLWVQHEVALCGSGIEEDAKIVQVWLLEPSRGS